MHRIVEWLRQAEAWLDEKGKPAWIVAMVLGFIFAWPIGLAILFYMIWSGRMMCGRSSWKRKSRRTGAGPTGNAAFDDYITRICAEIEGNGDARVSGDGRLAKRTASLAEGVQVSTELLAQLDVLAGSA